MRIHRYISLLALLQACAPSSICDSRPPLACTCPDGSESYRFCDETSGSYGSCECGNAPPMSDAGPATADAGMEPTPDAGASCLELLEDEYSPMRGPLPEPSESEDMMTVEDEGLTLDCHTVTRDATVEPRDIVALGSAYSAMQPGVIVDSTSVLEGLPSLVSLPRAPATLFIDLPVAQATRTVDAPSSASLRMAVSELVREADPVLGSLPEIPATLAIDVFEAESFEQARSQVGVSAQFSAPLFESDFRLDLESSRSVRERTVVVRLYQPMFTISVAEDEITSNREFFHPELGFEAAGLACSQLGDIPPALLSSVTYGRITLFTVTSSEVRSSEELATRLRAAYSGVVVGGAVEASVRDEYMQTMANASVRFVTFGGSQEDAFAALRSGDFRDFFQASRAIQAVPIAMRFNYLSRGRPPLTIRDTTSFSSVCCTPSDCPPPPTSSHEYHRENLNTGWHLGGTAGAVWGVRGGPCTAGRRRERVLSNHIGGTPAAGRPPCWYEWVTGDPTDCRARLWYSRNGSSYMHCEWIIYEQQDEPQLHDEPLCRPSGGSC